MLDLLVFATIEEAEATIDLLKARTSDARPWLYEHDRGFLLITGIGPFASFVSLHTLKFQVDTIYNFGLAGALRPTFELGQIYCVSKCSKLLWHPKGAEIAKAPHICSEVLLAAPRGLSLISSDIPIH